MARRDSLHPQSWLSLLREMRDGLADGHLFGIDRSRFYQPDASDPWRLPHPTGTLDTPLGVAAGPHTQLTRNIIVAWLLGARTIELKTVQTLDRLEVAKPCIDMEDEGYNCEWSQELTLDQSLQEYARAFVAIHLLQVLLFQDRQETPGVNFNLSVGYDLNGLLQPNVQRFLGQMTDSRILLHELIEQAAGIFPQVRELDLPAAISQEATLSTMHGCPPAEIEQMAEHLLLERDLPTLIKMNPTLLGPETVHRLLHDRYGFDPEIPRTAFEHDLQYADAIALIRRLRTKAARTGQTIGLKLTNTLEVNNLSRMLPEDEKQVYMSGRALHPLAVRLGRNLQREFSGSLTMSFSGGADAFNFVELVRAGFGPVTVCSDLLKPGGYLRLPQYMEQLDLAMHQSGSTSIAEFRQLTSEDPNMSPQEAAWQNLERYDRKLSLDPRYRKSIYPGHRLETGRELRRFDCIEAPCISGCAAGQDIPEYLRLTANGDFGKALSVVQETNWLPGVTGEVCDRPCQQLCTRSNLDEPLHIREIKRFLVHTSPDRAGGVHQKSQGIRVAVVGAGPAGIACAGTLAEQGVQVDLFDEAAAPGGMLQQVIPGFRLDRSILRHDLRRLENSGVRLHMSQHVSAKLLEKLEQEHDALYLAPGARLGLKMRIPGDDLDGVTDALDFLRDIRDRGDVLAGGSQVLVVGGGNSAMDVARSAIRLTGSEGFVTVLYRRTRSEMPADPEELEAANHEGVRLQERVMPVKINRQDGSLIVTCVRMEPGKISSQKHGLQRPVPRPVPGSEFVLRADHLIMAIGQRLDFETHWPETPQPRNGTAQTQYPGVYMGGDSVRGAGSIIHAVADGQQAAAEILLQQGVDISAIGPAREPVTREHFQHHIGSRCFSPVANHVASDSGVNSPRPQLTEDAARQEAKRCLQCDTRCDICVTVCPNRALIDYQVEPNTWQLPLLSIEQGRLNEHGKVDFAVLQQAQVLVLVDYCNECGNCATFCPTAGRPYRDKPLLALNHAAWEADEQSWLLQELQEGAALRSRSATGETLVIMDREYIRYRTSELELVFGLDFKFDAQASTVNKEACHTPDMLQIAEQVVVLGGLRRSRPEILSSLEVH